MKTVPSLRSWVEMAGEMAGSAFQILLMLSDKLPDLDMSESLTFVKLPQVLAVLASDMEVDVFAIHACGWVLIPRSVPPV